MFPKIGLTLTLLTATLMMTGCPSDGGGVGVCTAYSPLTHATYCYNNYTKAECDDRSANDVNGADTWYFYAGQTCADRGLNEGSN